ncbi:molybdenum cofactor guanylyltransferase [Deinococcus psychrotolerans]|uniref:Probable molybdenum cofactor guanylyltransferase n=1 Tax=Deinococcus psychrotolerans TaxID=2489213 RepID=A0A3G8YIX7_9DEIO|nr:molybdenum cofactor guanylyltransferase [Deinococcus psychrotolerans]AZI42504.1 molybdenum cofactor guanylyltransferase [Deinococcus psychrotolerans]
MLPAAPPPAIVTAAIITAGGASRRFGSDKALARLGGQTLLERVAASLENHAPRILVAPPCKYELGGWHNVPDTRSGEGPLAGLEAGLGALKTGALEPQLWAAFAAVDLPYLTPEFWARLAQFRAPNAQAVIGHSSDKRKQPLAALYHVSSLSTVTALLDKGERRMLALLDELAVIEVGWAELESAAPQAYQNVNRVEDLSENNS